MARWREAGWGRGAFCVGLAYAFVLQLFVAGIAFERAGGAALASMPDGGALCAPSTAVPDNNPASPQADHSVCCALCAFHSLAPILPVAADTGRPVAGPAISARAASAVAEGTGRERREPRSSQGPPFDA